MRLLIGRYWQKIVFVWFVLWCDDWYTCRQTYTSLNKEKPERNNNNNNNNKEKTCTLIDVAIPADRNVVQKEADKKLKYEYKSLCIEIQRMWNLKCTIIPIIIGATGIVTRSLRKNLEAVPGKHLIDSLQKTAILEEHHT